MSIYSKHCLDKIIKDRMEQVQLKTRMYLTMQSVQFIGIDSQVMAGIYFWGQSITVISLFNQIAKQFSPLGSDFNLLFQINYPFLFYLSPTYEEWDTIYNLSIIIMIALIFLYVLIFLLFAVCLRRQSTQVGDSWQTNLLSWLTYFVVIMGITLGGCCGKAFVSAINSASSYLIVLSFFNLLVLAALVFFLENLNVDITFVKKKILTRLPSPSNAWLQAFKVLLSAFLVGYQKAFDGMSKQFLTVLVSMLLLPALSQLIKLIVSPRYLSATAERMNLIKIVTQLTLKLGAFVCLLSESGLILQNYLLSCMQVIFFFSLALIRYSDYHFKQLIQERPSLLKSETDALVYSQEMVLLLHPSQTEEVLLTSLLELHKRECKETVCFCRPDFQNTADNINQPKSRIKFVQEKLNAVQNQFQNSFMIVLVLAVFKLQFTNAFAKATQIVQVFIAKHTSFSFHQQNLLAQFRQAVKLNVKKSKQHSQEIPIEKFFADEQLRATLNTTISGIIVQITEKYRRISLDFCNLNSVQELLDDISDRMQEMNRFEKQLQMNGSQNKRIYEILLIYTGLVIENKTAAENVLTTLKRKLQAAKALRGFDRKSLHVQAYSGSGCVLESDVLPERMGWVTNVSKSCEQVLQVNRDALIGKDIHNFFPEFLIEAHRAVVNAWVERENFQSTSQFDRIREIYFLSASHECFEGHIYIKLNPSPTGIRLYALLLRNNDEDFFILNPKQELEGYGKKLGLLFNHASIKKPFSFFSNVDLQFLLKDQNRTRLHIKFTAESRKQAKESHRDSLGANVFSLGDDRLMYLIDGEIIRTNIGKVSYFAVHVRSFEKVKNTAESKSNKRMSLAMLILTNIEKENLSDLVKEMSSEDINERLSSREFDTRENQSSFNRMVMNKDGSIVTDSTRTDNNTNISSMLVDLWVKMKESRSNDSVHFKFTTRAAILFGGVLIALMVVQYLLFRTGLTSFNDVIFGDGAISDNNQMLEIIYNHDLSISQNCLAAGKQVRCGFVIRSGQFISEVVSALLASDVNVHVRNLTSLSGRRIFQYYDVQANITFTQTLLQNTPQQTHNQTITSQIFSLFWLYNVRIIRGLYNQKNMLGKLSPNDEQLIEESFTFLFRNWGTMKQINHGQIAYYQQMGLEEIQLLTKLLYLVFVAIFIINLVFLCFLKAYFNSLEDGRVEIMKLHSYISPQHCEIERKYFDQVQQLLKKQVFEPIRRENTLGVNKRKTHPRFKKSQLHKYVLLIMILILILALVLSAYTMLSLFPAAKDGLTLINDMMDSQNYLLENLFELKTYYLAYNFSRSEEQQMKQILVSLNQSEVLFNEYSRRATDIFASIDVSYASTFRSLLIDNVCDLTANLFQDWQVEKCRHGFNYPVLAEGLTATMNFFQRQTLKALITLRSNSSQSANFFMQPSYEDIDDSLFFMFRLYQATQATVIQGLDQAILIKLAVSFNFILTIIFITLAIIVIWWCCRVRERKKLSNLYSIILQYPRTVLRENTVIVRIIENIVSKHL